MKLKTKSGAKKRFRFTASGKIKAKHAGKRHGMVHKTPNQIRNLRKGMIIADSDVKLIHAYMPYNRRRKKKTMFLDFIDESGLIHELNSTNEQVEGKNE